MKEIFKQNLHSLDIPIILITASTADIAQKAEECQAVDFIAKPIDSDILLEKVSRHLG